MKKDSGEWDGFNPVVPLRAAMRGIERLWIVGVLRNSRSVAGAARTLGLPTRTLFDKFRQLDIEWKDHLNRMVLVWVCAGFVAAHVGDQSGKIFPRTARAGQARTVRSARRLGEGWI